MDLEQVVTGKLLNTQKANSTLSFNITITTGIGITTDILLTTEFCEPTFYYKFNLQFYCMDTIKTQETQ